MGRQKSHSIRGSDNSIDLEGEGTGEWCLKPYNIRVPKIESSRAEGALVIPLSLVGLRALLPVVSTRACLLSVLQQSLWDFPLVDGLCLFKMLTHGTRMLLPEAKRQRPSLPWLET